MQHANRLTGVKRVKIFLIQIGPAGPDRKQKWTGSRTGPKDLGPVWSGSVCIGLRVGPVPNHLMNTPSEESS